MPTKTTLAAIAAIAAIAGFALAATSANAALTVSSYTYDSAAESQPQPTSFQSGLISDVGDIKLTDGAFATGTWNDGTNVGFRNDADNGAPQPRIVFDLGGLHNMTTVDIWTVTTFLSSTESVSISSSTDNVSFSTPVVVDPIIWTGGFTNTNLRQGSIDVSSLPAGQYYQVDVFDDAQWMMINEVEFTGTAVPEPATTALLGLGGLALILRRRK